MKPLRIGSFGISIIVLTFMVLSLTSVNQDLEDSIGVTGVSSNLASIESNASLRSQSNSMTGTLSDQVDNASDLAASDDQQVEDRAASASGVLNLFSKNIVLNFIKAINKEFPIPGEVIFLVSSLVAVIVTLLVVRFFFGRDKT